MSLVRAIAGACLEGMSTAEANIVDVYIRYLYWKIDLPGQRAISKLSEVSAANARTTFPLMKLSKGFLFVKRKRKEEEIF